MSVSKGFRGGLDYRAALRRARRVSAPSGNEERDRAPCSTAGNRTCLVTRVSGPRHKLLRFVVSPQGILVPDVKGVLPGRGLWLTPQRDVVEYAVRKEVFIRAARKKVKVPQDLADGVGQALKDHCLGFWGLRRAGLVVNGLKSPVVSVRRLLCCFTRGITPMDVGRWLVCCSPWSEILERQIRLIVYLFSHFWMMIWGCVGRDYAVHVAVLRGALLTNVVVCLKLHWSDLQDIARQCRTGAESRRRRQSRPRQ